ncbi:hypothetical protein GGI02_000552 [Coemansia sp. RSA 2322]|uniref:Uncharacterized protein n=1 Tax=Coemansia thaxteri TaxID=2663907 RepID=A0A9W8EE76_9FUNG|nr:hypothetical protein H4R26_003861 [Coemansia thaxteri]KAJ2473873.1 hypothetical protein GGI02_000552 [Coemansia sp. RSA 2322]
MDHYPHYTYSPQPMARRQSSQARPAAPATADVPHGRRQSAASCIRVVHVGPREAGIGGYAKFYRRSDIGLNIAGARDSGIGKTCVEKTEEPGGVSASMRRLSATFARRMPGRRRKTQ